MGNVCVYVCVPKVDAAAAPPSSSPAAPPSRCRKEDALPLWLPMPPSCFTLPASLLLLSSAKELLDLLMDARTLGARSLAVRRCEGGKSCSGVVMALNVPRLLRSCSSSKQVRPNSAAHAVHSNSCAWQARDKTTVATIHCSLPAVHTEASISPDQVGISRYQC
eukprot:1155474-Pelagomonas_calceolata.AAC.2